jgi:glucose/arabinose dehydrogenase/mono/diheme cytochrome c family protein
MRHVTPFTFGLLITTALSSHGLAAEAASSENIAHGKAVFQPMCAVCHTTAPGGVSAQGPNLAGVLGRRAASLPRFGYTKALSESKLTWDEATLDRFLANPTGTVPGTNMVVGVPNPQDRRDIIAFLSTLEAGPDTAPAAAGAKASAPDDSDWTHDAPGVRHIITVDKLAAPFATASAGNNPKLVARPADARLSVLPGFTVKEFATNLSGPRLLRVAPNGDIFVSETRANRVRVFRAADGAESPSSDEVFANGLDRPFGIAFYPAGNDPKWVYIANNNSIVRFPYHAGDLKAQGKPEVIVARLAETTGGHSTRDIAFSKDGKRLLVTIGSGSNVAEDIPKKSPEEVKAWEAEHGRGAAWGSETNRAAILFTDPEGKQPLRTFATGIRNGVGMGVDPLTGDVWIATNERDGLGDNLVPDYVTRVKEGGFYGWPWYYLGNHEDPRHAGERPDLAGQAIVPDVLFQSHSAALELTFYTATSGAAVFPAEYRGEMFVALHGSWNRENRTGYKVVRIRRHNGVATGEYEDFLTGFVVDRESVWGRPVGVTVAHDGALLVTDDGSNTLWRIAHESK